MHHIRGNAELWCAQHCVRISTFVTTCSAPAAAAPACFAACRCVRSCSHAASQMDCDCFRRQLIAQQLVDITTITLAKAHRLRSWAPGFWLFSSNPNPSAICIQYRIAACLEEALYVVILNKEAHIMPAGFSNPQNSQGFQWSSSRSAVALGDRAPCSTTSMSCTFKCAADSHGHQCGAAAWSGTSLLPNAGGLGTSPVQVACKCCAQYML